MTPSFLWYRYLFLSSPPSMTFIDTALPSRLESRTDCDLDHQHVKSFSLPGFVPEGSLLGAVCHDRRLAGCLSSSLPKRNGLAEFFQRDHAGGGNIYSLSSVAYNSQHWTGSGIYPLSQKQVTLFIDIEN